MAEKISIEYISTKILIIGELLCLGKKTLLCLSSTSLLFSAPPDQQLYDALSNADTSFDFPSDITLTAGFGQPILFPVNSTKSFAPIAQTMTINGNGFTLSGAGTFRGFFVRGGSVVINNLTFSNTRARGNLPPHKRELSLQLIVGFLFRLATKGSLIAKLGSMKAILELSDYFKKG